MKLYKANRKADVCVLFPVDRTRISRLGNFRAPGESFEVPPLEWRGAEGDRATEVAAIQGMNWTWMLSLDVHDELDASLRDELLSTETTLEGEVVLAVAPRTIFGIDDLDLDQSGPVFVEGTNEVRAVRSVVFGDGVEPPGIFCVKGISRDFIMLSERGRDLAANLVDRANFSLGTVS